MEKAAGDNAETHDDDKNESINRANEKDNDTSIIQKRNLTKSTLEVMENLPDAINMRKATRELSKDEEDNEIEEIPCFSTLRKDAIANIHETKYSNKISSSEVITNIKLMGEDAGKSFGTGHSIASDGEQNVAVDIRATSMKECMASVFAEDNIMNPATCQFQEGTPSKVDLINEKCHNLSISELRRKLAFCPICQIQYSNHKLANMCLAKHGKRQCWLCLDILSSKKDDFYKHCIEYHCISKNGDIVGCPFCRKYFDFRQGLNQHIVKIHFAESISDLDAVASLSPTTLVDIFTGKPRSSSSSSEDIQSQHQQCQNDYHGPLVISLSGAERDQYDPINISMECPNVETSLSISPVPVLPFSETPQSQQQKEQPGSLCTRLSSFSRSFSKTSDILQSSSDIIANFSRPSVIALLGHTMQRISVPPEQTLSSLIVEEIEPRSSESVQKQNNAFDQLENNVEMVENSCLRLQKCMAADLVFSKSAPSMQMRVAPNPEKYDMLSYPDLSVHNDSRVSTTSAPSSYEKLIKRVPNVFQQQNPSLASQSFIDIGANNGPGATSNSHLDVNDMFPDVNKGYHNSIGSMLKTVSDLEFNDQSVVQNSGALLCPTEALGNQMDSASFPCTTDCQKTGRATCLNQEIALNNCGAPKFPDNCGVKRRILMKAMWDEHQFKKPTHSHALVHDLNNATSLLAPPSSHKTPDLRVATFSRGNQDDLNTNGNRRQQNIQQIMATNREPKKDAGPFFEQYVREDRQRQGIPFKLLDLARAPNQAQKNAAVNTLNNLSPVTTSGGQVYNSYDYLNDTSSCAANSSLQSNSLQCVAPNFPRGQTPSNSNYLRGRRPSNPAFWDGLRARLMGSQNLRQTNVAYGFNPSRSTFQNPTSYFDCRYSGKQAVENIIVQNPFDEETSFSQRSLSNRALYGNSDSRNKMGCSRVVVGSENVTSQQNDQMVFATGISNAPTFMNRYNSTMRHHPYTKNTATSTYTSAQQTSNECDSRMTNMMTFTQFGTEANNPEKDEAHNNIFATQQANLQPRYCDVAAQDEFQTNFGQPLLIAPRYSEQYHYILNRLHNMDKSKLCK